MTDPVVDLRSDTVTRPTAAMRRAMAEAEVGDDVYHEDPTVNRLEERAAEIFGREAGLFVPSGTMGNQAAIKVHTHHGQEVICEARAHIFNYEMATMAAFSGCVPRPIWAEDGILSWDLIAPQIRGRSGHHARTGLIELENTANLAGGSVYPPEIADAICDRTRAAGLPIHLDGARIFNASTASGVSVQEYAKLVDSVMFCLSKGLSAPVGSMLVGSKGFIEYGRRLRKALGGGMRQVGVLAAPGLIALMEMVGRLKDDHRRAKTLSKAIAGMPGISLEPDNVETNIIIFGFSHPKYSIPHFLTELKNRGIWAMATTGGIRFVTHKDIDDEDVDRAIRAFREILAN